VPKSVRKRLRAEAKAQGITVDDLVARILDAYLP
jgi:predicted HicB family RNase H-like nuclease